MRSGSEEGLIARRVALEFRDGDCVNLGIGPRPPAGEGDPDRIVTEMAVIDVGPGGLTLVEVYPDYDVKDVVAATEARLSVGDVRPMSV